jgi:hypothetical protein
VSRPGLVTFGRPNAVSQAGMRGMSF